MREGYTADDVWMMVEDEFLATAQLYTRHLHQAEYAKLKRLARARGQATIQDIGRAVDGRTEQSRELKLKLEADKGAKRIGEGLRRAGLQEGDQGEDEDGYINDVFLSGLMTEERNGAVELKSLTKPGATAKAAAGREQSPESAKEAKRSLGSGSKKVNGTPSGRQIASDATDSEEMDGLDPPLRRKKSTMKAASSDRRADAGTTPSDLKKRSLMDSRSARIFPPREGTSSNMRLARDDTSSTRGPDLKVPNAANGSLSKAQITEKASVASDSHPVGPSADRVAASEYIAKRKATKEQKEKDRREEEKRRSKAADDVPTWLV